MTFNDLPALLLYAALLILVVMKEYEFPAAQCPNLGGDSFVVSGADRLPTAPFYMSII